jgi:hypothetical protein
MVCGNAQLLFSESGTREIEMKKFWIWGAIGGMTLGVALSSMAEEMIIVDRYEVKVAEVSADTRMAIKEFSTENTDFGKLKKEKQKETAGLMKRAAPPAYQEAVMRRLSEYGAFKEVEAYQEGDSVEADLFLEGEFTILNPGNRAKRYWAMGASGKSRICVAGRIVDADGKEMLNFEDCRTGIGFWTVGGNSAGLMMADIDHSGEYLADFMTAWVKGELPALVSQKKLK